VRGADVRPPPLTTLCVSEHFMLWRKFHNTTMTTESSAWVGDWAVGSAVLAGSAAHPVHMSRHNATSRLLRLIAEVFFCSG